MSRLAFLLSKDPVLEQSGDVAIMRLLLDLARRDHHVAVICLSEHLEAPAEPALQRLPKPTVRRAGLALRALRRRRSLLHARFDLDTLVTAIDRTEADTFVAVHHYMAEAFLRSSRAGRARLLVSHVVPEAEIWRHGHGLVGRQQARAITRDETRVARAADAVGAYDEHDALAATAAGARRAVWLEVTLPPRERLDVAAAPPRLVLLGDRTWAPNQQAHAELMGLWQRIAEGIGGAELVVVGRPGPRSLPAPPGVRDLGFVDDLDAVLAGCRALVAPIRVGGGVRVKLLEAASRGLPVVATGAATGSLRGLLGLEPHELDDQFVAQCRRLLQHPELAAAEGRRLHAANADHWRVDRPYQTFRQWVGP